MKSAKRFLLLSLVGIPAAMWAARSRKEREEAKNLEEDSLLDAEQILKGAATPAPQPGQPGMPAEPPLPKPKGRELSDDEKELVTKLARLVKKKYGGNPKNAFDSHAGPDGLMSKSELKDLLEEAGIGYGVTRGTWAEKIIETVDTNGDGKISWLEYQAAIQ